MTHSPITIQIAPQSLPSTPSWMGEVAAFAQVLMHTGLLKTIQVELRFARARFGHYDLVDFVVVLIGSILSGEPTLFAFYERLAPWALPFMALFRRASVAPSFNPVPFSRLFSIRPAWKRCGRSAQKDSQSPRSFLWLKLSHSFPKRS